MKLPKKIIIILSEVIYTQINMVCTPLHLSTSTYVTDNHATIGRVIDIGYKGLRRRSESLLEGDIESIVLDR